MTGFLVPEDDCCLPHVIKYAVTAPPASHDNSTNFTLTFEPVFIKVQRGDNTYTIGQKGNRINLIVIATA